MTDRGCVIELAGNAGGSSSCGTKLEDYGKLGPNRATYSSASQLDMLKDDLINNHLKIIHLNN